LAGAICGESCQPLRAAPLTTLRSIPRPFAKSLKFLQIIFHHAGISPESRHWEPALDL
jgi:hypothetical protein